jgi:hypothetical protein
LPEEIWKKILEEIRLVNTSVEALLRAAKPINFDGKILQLGVYYRFHKERLEEAKHKQILEDVIKKIINEDVRVSCVLSEPPKKVYSKPKDEVVLTETGDDDIVKIAKNIFNS